MRNFGIKTAVILVLVSQAGNLLLVAASFEHLVRPFFVERAAHAVISWLHGKDGRAFQPPSLPDAVLHHA